MEIEEGQEGDCPSHCNLKDLCWKIGRKFHCLEAAFGKLSEDL